VFNCQGYSGVPHPLRYGCAPTYISIGKSLQKVARSLGSQSNIRVYLKQIYVGAQPYSAETAASEAERPRERWRLGCLLVSCKELNEVGRRNKAALLTARIDRSLKTETPILRLIDLVVGAIRTMPATATELSGAQVHLHLDRACKSSREREFLLYFGCAFVKDLAQADLLENAHRRCRPLYGVQERLERPLVTLYSLPSACEKHFVGALCLLYNGDRKESPTKQGNGGRTCCFRVSPFT
jgi:hypothetical protein